MVKELLYKMDFETYQRNSEITTLEKNDIGRLRIRVAQPLCVDEYDQNRITGSFIIIDEANNNTVGACMIRYSDN